jgi:DNA polymerase-3 subunit alpha
VTKKSYEALILGGGLDSTGHTNRAAFFAKSGRSETFIEDLIKYGQTVKKHSTGIQQTLFGDISNVMVEKPPLPDIEPWPLMEKLEKEKEVTGIYITGHPLEEFEFEIENYTTNELSMINLIKDRIVKVAGIVTSEYHSENKRGLPYGKFSIQDFDGTLEFTLTNEVYHKFNTYLKIGQVVYVEGINQKGYSSDNYFFRVTDVRLLDTVGKVLTKSITLFMPAGLINLKLISDLSSLCKKYKGQHKLKVIFSEGENSITTVSKTIQVNVSNDFVQKLKKLGIRYKIN